MTDIFRELREESVKTKIIAKELSPQGVGGCACTVYREDFKCSRGE